MAYIAMWAGIIVSLAVYVSDIYTAIVLLAFDRWSSSIEPYVPFRISRWIFGGCIILSIVLIIYDYVNAVIVIRGRNISFNYTTPIARNILSIKRYSYFCLFAKITKSKSKVEYLALFVFFSFKGWIRLLAADSPRQVLNALTLYSVLQVQDNFVATIKKVGNEHLTEAIVLGVMAFSLLVWVIHMVFFITAIILWLPLYIKIGDGYSGLEEYCCSKINKRISKLVEKKHKQGMIELIEENKRLKYQPTLPKFSVDDEYDLKAFTGQRVAKLRTKDSSTTLVEHETSSGIPLRRINSNASLTSFTSYSSHQGLLSHKASVESFKQSPQMASKPTQTPLPGGIIPRRPTNLPPPSVYADRRPPILPTNSASRVPIGGQSIPQSNLLRSQTGQSRTPNDRMAEHYPMSAPGNPRTNNPYENPYATPDVARDTDLNTERPVEGMQLAENSNPPAYSYDQTRMQGVPPSVSPDIPLRAGSRGLPAATTMSSDNYTNGDAPGVVEKSGSSYAYNPFTSSTTPISRQPLEQYESVPEQVTTKMPIFSKNELVNLDTNSNRLSNILNKQPTIPNIKIADFDETKSLRNSDVASITKKVPTLPNVTIEEESETTGESQIPSAAAVPRGRTLNDFIFSEQSSPSNVLVTPNSRHSKLDLNGVLKNPRIPSIVNILDEEEE